MCNNDETPLYRIWNKELLEFGCSNLAEELVLPPVVPGGMPDYRLSLALSFFYKFYLFVTKQNTPDLVSSKELSAFEVIKCNDCYYIIIFMFIAISKRCLKE